MGDIQDAGALATARFCLKRDIFNRLWLPKTCQQRTVMLLPVNLFPDPTIGTGHKGYALISHEIAPFCE